MCGICGFAGFEDKGLLKRMARLMEHRGPDDEGFYTDETVCLANRRLSIIDLAGGHQPIPNEDETKWVVQNGEIYNYRELRRELEGRHDFRTNSDTEVILHAFEEWGDDCVKKFNGVFAFVVWDSEKKRLFAARDHVGVKPFFYYLDADNNLAFGSEVKCILAYPFERKLNKLGLHYLLSFYALLGEETMFEGIKKLEPGRSLSYDAKTKKLEVRRYWVPTFRHSGVSFREASREFGRKLEEAVQRQLVSDVPVGALLSGGLDSSSLVALMRKHSNEPVKTFSMGFGGSTDELDDARLVAEAFSTDHREFVIDPFEAFKIYPQLIWHVDAPKVNNIYSYFVYEAVRRKVKVCLSGTGGDEVAGGYVYRHNQISFAQSYNAFAPKLLRRLMAATADKLSAVQDKTGRLQFDRLKRYLGFFRHSDDWTRFYLKVGGELLDDAHLNKAYGPAMKGFGERQVTAFFKPLFENSLDPQDKFLLAEFETSLPDDLLSVDDAMSMANSLEVRVPFLDVNLIEFSLGLPIGYKYASGKGKLVLREALKGVLPEAVFKKPKCGFGPSFFEWYSRGVKPLAEEVLDDPLIAKNGLVEKSYVKKVLGAPLNRAMNRHYSLLQSLLGLEVWYRIYMEGDSLEKPKQL